MSEKKTNPFKLRDLRGVRPETLAALQAQGIKTAPHMLAAAHSKAQRAELAARTGVPESELFELACLSDLARLPGVKGIRARLYYEAGVRSVADLAAWEPEALRRLVTDYVERTGFDGIPPLPKEVSSTVANARRLPVILDGEGRRR